MGLTNLEKLQLFRFGQLNLKSLTQLKVLSVGEISTEWVTKLVNLEVLIMYQCTANLTDLRTLPLLRHIGFVFPYYLVNDEDDDMDDNLFLPGVQILQIDCCNDSRSEIRNEELVSFVKRLPNLEILIVVGSVYVSSRGINKVIASTNTIKQVYLISCKKVKSSIMHSNKVEVFVGEDVKCDAMFVESWTSKINYYD